jgi:YfiH family protein
MNLGLHVGDAPEAVQENRRLAMLNVDAKPVWLHQVHGASVAVLDKHTGEAAPEADAAVSVQPGYVCAVLVADCLPVFVADRDGSVVGVAHAGWRGLNAGVLEATVTATNRPAAQLMAFLGPAIGPSAFEVGTDVREAFIARDAQAATAFVPIAGRPGKWWCDLYTLARQRLQKAGVNDVSGGTHCTLSDADRFFSYRRDGITGRMGAFIRLRD